MDRSLVRLSRGQVLALVPHGPEALFLGGATLVPGQRAFSQIDFDGTESCFRGHYAREPILPGSALIEIFGQLGAVLSSSVPELAGQRLVLAGVERFRAYSLTIPPCTLIVHADIQLLRSGVMWLACQAKSPSGIGIARATLIVAIGAAEGKQLEP